MAAIKHKLQRDVFLPSEERLVGVAQVNKVGKKKKPCYLCAAVTTEKPIQALIYQVKKSDRGDTFKKKASWMLRELKVLDGKDAHRDTVEIDLQFDKTYKWIAGTLTEKNNFIQCLWKMCQRYLHQKPEFVNVHPGLIHEEPQLGETDKKIQVEEETAMTAASDYQALSSKEEGDLETLMSQCEYAISNAEAFTQGLSKELSILDGANIHSIMGSEDQVIQLMELIDTALLHAGEVEDKLDEYDNKLSCVKDLMEIMKDKDSIIQVRTSNHKQLLEQLDGLVGSLDLDHRFVRCLIDGDLSTANGISDCTKAAEALQKCMSAEIHPSLEKMAAVQEQRKKFGRFKASFGKRLSHYLNNLFIHQGNELGETLSRYASDPRLPHHQHMHQDLLPYANLMLWLSNADPDSFSKLKKVYTGSLNKLYDKEVKDFIESAKQKLAVRPDRRAPGGATPYPSQLSGSSSSLNKLSHRTASQSTLDSYHGSDIDVSGRAKFDQMFENVLSELEPVCLAEQEFCVKFFHLTVAAEQDKKDSPRGKLPLSRTQRTISEDIRSMMTELFPSLEQELNGFLNFGEKVDQFNAMTMLVRMNQHVSNAQDTGSFLVKTFGNCLVQIKRLFDRFIQNQIIAIQDTRPPKKSRVGIINFVHSFEDFAQQAETIFKASDRRTDLDKAYVKLVTTVFKEIERLAMEQQKTPKDVVMFENYHHMHSMLAQLKISCLDSQRKEAKQLYQQHVQAYVTLYLGRPMEKLSTFFEGVESKVASGVKAEEVGYQLAFSKQELRKVIKEYPPKEVKKGLEHLYRKVEKHLSEEESLQEVVWHSMQDEFLKQYQHFAELIKKCYPGSQISLEFSIEDLLNYFSEIAQSH